MIVQHARAHQSLLQSSNVADFPSGQASQTIEVHEVCYSVHTSVLSVCLFK